MGSKEARTIVQRGLDQRKADRRAAELENRLEQYERDMIAACNDRHTAHPELVTKGKECCDKLAAFEAQEARRTARREAKAQEARREKMAFDAVKCYALACLALLLLSAWTRFPLWAVLTFTLFGMLLPLAYVLRLYNTPQNAKEDDRER